MIIFALLLCLSGVSPAQKNKLNTNLYEKSEAETSLDGKVKTIREVQEETEVVIDTKHNSGPYVLPQGIKDRAKMLKSLQKSQKPGGPSMTIRIDDQQRIKSVEESKSSAESHPEWKF
jgi:hypothetical protein